MKTLFRITIAALIVATAAGCDAFKTLNNSKKSAQGKPYELIVVCPQAEWTGEVGDSLRAIFTAPVPYLNQIEPIFDVLRVTERGFTGMVADHRNILKILVDPELKETTTAVQYDVTSDPQIVRSADRDDAARPQRRSAGEIPLGKPGEPRLCARKGRTRPRREGQRDLWQLLSL